jgi:hypothetical protein
MKVNILFSLCVLLAANFAFAQDCRYDYYKQEHIMSCSGRDKSGTASEAEVLKNSNDCGQYKYEVRIHNIYWGEDHNNPPQSFDSLGTCYGGFHCYAESPVQENVFTVFDLHRDHGKISATIHDQTGNPQENPDAKVYNSYDLYCWQ